MKRKASSASWLTAVVASSAIWFTSHASAQSTSEVWNDFGRSVVKIDGYVRYDGPGASFWTRDVPRDLPTNYIGAPNYYEWNSMELVAFTAPNRRCGAWIDLTAINNGDAEGIFFSALNGDGSVRAQASVPHLPLAQSTNAFFEFWSDDTSYTTIRVGLWGNGRTPSLIELRNLYVYCGAP